MKLTYVESVGIKTSYDVFSSGPYELPEGEDPYGQL